MSVELASRLLIAGGAFVFVLAIILIWVAATAGAYNKNYKDTSDDGTGRYHL